MKKKIYATIDQVRETLASGNEPFLKRPDASLEEPVLIAGYFLRWGFAGGEYSSYNEIARRFWRKYQRWTRHKPTRRRYI